MVQPDLPGTRVRLSTIAAHSDDPDGVVPRLTQVEQGPVPSELHMVSPELQVSPQVSPELQGRRPALALFQRTRGGSPRQAERLADLMVFRTCRRPTRL